MNRLRWIWIWVWLGACSSPGSVESTAEVPEEDPVLARVYDEELTLSQLPIVSAASVASKDSAEMIRKAVDRWIHEQLFLQEAAKNVPEELDIEKLIEEYRSSLIRHYFEEKLIKTKLDTVITEFDLKAHYEENKDLYALEKSILRCLYIKVRKPVPRLKKMEQWLEDREDADYARLRKYCMNNAEFCLMNPEKWYQWDDIKESFPDKIQRMNLKTGAVTTFADFKYQYYIHILEYVSKKSDAPFSYIEERATKLIIRERKNRLLEELKQQLYEEERDGGNIEIFVQ